VAAAPCCKSCLEPASGPRRPIRCSRSHACHGPLGARDTAPVLSWPVLPCRASGPLASGPLVSGVWCLLSAVWYLWRLCTTIMPCTLFQNGCSVVICGVGKPSAHSSRRLERRDCCCAGAGVHVEGLALEPAASGHVPSQASGQSTALQLTRLGSRTASLLAAAKSNQQHNNCPLGVPPLIALLVRK
jgi:hypothetical protein